jgi:tetratricopeptide (TPR) repeat protein
MTPIGRRLVFSLAAVSLVAVIRSAPMAAAADRPWLEVKSPHFIVLSDAGENSARTIAWQFEQVRSVLEKLLPWTRLDTDKPVVVFAARNEQTLKTLAPSYWEVKGGLRPSGVFVSGRDRHYIALRTDVTQPDSVEANPYYQTYWSYVYLVLEWSLDRPLPLWMARGMSGFFANTIVRDKDLQVGRVVPWDLRTLRDTPLLPLATVLSVDRQSSYMTRAEDHAIFDAAAWAYVHYLIFGERGANLPRFNRLAQALAAGTDQAAALAQIYGDLPKIEGAVRNYVQQSAFVFQQFKLDVNVSPQGFTTRALSAADASSAQAALHAAMGRPADGHRLAQEVIRSDAKVAAAYEAEGLLCDREGKKDEARAAFDKAVELGSASPYAYYRHAQLLWTATPDATTRARIEKSLEKAIELSSNYAAAYSYLSDLKVDQDQADQAVVLAQRAVALEPSVSYHRCSLARALARTGKRTEAMEEAAKALALARDASDRDRAEKLLAWLKR